MHSFAGSEHRSNTISRVNFVLHHFCTVPPQKVIPVLQFIDGVLSS